MTSMKPMNANSFDVVFLVGRQVCAIRSPPLKTEGDIGSFLSKSAFMRLLPCKSPEASPAIRYNFIYISEITMGMVYNKGYANQAHCKLKPLELKIAEIEKYKIGYHGKHQWIIAIYFIRQQKFDVR